MRALIIEDDPDFSTEISGYLARNGLKPMTFGGINQFETFIESDLSGSNDVMLLDLGLGSENGLEFLSRRCDTTRMPCIVLTGNDNQLARILALEMGADDYIIKTTPPREILARIHAVMRRSGKEGISEPATDTAGEWQLSPMRRDLLNADGTAAGLTAAEYGVLFLLVKNPGEPVDRNILSRAVLHRDSDPTDRSLDNLVSRVRRKIIACGGQENCIRSIRNHGYVFLGWGGGPTPR